MARQEQGLEQDDRQEEGGGLEVSGGVGQLLHTGSALAAEQPTESLTWPGTREITVLVLSWMRRNMKLKKTLVKTLVMSRMPFLMRKMMLDITLMKYLPR